VCTASWRIDPEGFELFFNRDESLRRGPGSPPAELELDGVRALAPRDADAGGTWLGVNEHGLALALLNGWEEHAPPRAPRSRGLLVRELLSARDGDEALARLERAALERYRAFTLACFEPARPPRARAWDGRALAAVAAEAPLCSSSLERGRAREERVRVYARLVGSRPERAALERFQASHEPARGPWSPCMHSAEAATVSATEVRVGERAVALRYAAGPPCTAAFGPWLELARAPARPVTRG